MQEKESGKRGVLRPAWQELLPLPQPGNTLKFWKSDRWGRSAADVLATVNELCDRGVTVVSLTENFNLGAKESRLMFGVLALAAEYELELRAERQADGIAAARRRQAEGRMLPGKKHIGRPLATGPAELAALRDLIVDGKSVTEAARILKIGRSTARMAEFAETGSGMPSRYAEYARRGGKGGYEIEHIWANHPERHEDEFSHPSEFADRRVAGAAQELQRQLR